MVWNYHDDDKQAPAGPVQLNIVGLPSKTIILTHYRIDNMHSNSYEVWKKMGSPQNPTNEQIKELEKAGQLQTISKQEKLKVTSGKLVINFSLPRQGISLVKLDW